jgi:hypothetical protein
MTIFFMPPTDDRHPEERRQARLEGRSGAFAARHHSSSIA